MFSHEMAALYTRDLTRLVQELNAFPDTATLWQTRAGITNSAGNLSLHLEGNLREFIGRLLGEHDLNRTGILGGLISWEDGVYGTSKSVCTGGT